MSADFREVGGLYYSLMAQPGTLVFRKTHGLKEAWYVVASNEYGATGIKAVPHRKSDNARYIRIDTSPNQPLDWKFLHISDHSQWHCHNIEVVPPSCATEVLGQSVSVASIWLVVPRVSSPRQC